MREQGVFINCSLEMPVEPTEKNFKQFEQENPSIHLNMYTPAADEEKCVIMPLYVGKNRGTKIINILYYKLEQRSHYAYIWSISCLIYNSTKSHNKKFVCRTVHALISTARKLSLTTSTRSIHTSTMNLYVRSARMCFTQQRQRNFMTASV